MPYGVRQEPGAGDPGDLDPVREWLAAVQDEGSQLAARPMPQKFDLVSTVARQSAAHRVTGQQAISRTASRGSRCRCRCLWSRSNCHLTSRALG